MTSFFREWLRKPIGSIDVPPTILVKYKAHCLDDLDILKNWKCRLDEGSSGWLAPGRVRIYVWSEYEYHETDGFWTTLATLDKFLNETSCQLA